MEKMEGYLAIWEQTLTCVNSLPPRPCTSSPGNGYNLRVIRAGLFHQERAVSPMDQQMDTVLQIINELITIHGVFHAKMHFSSSRATFWQMNDPYRFRLHGIDELGNPDLCLAYPRIDYPADAGIPAEAVIKILKCFRELRFMDETIYLRSGLLNIFNGMIGLTFSCDGSHYMPWDEFLDKNLDFWTGGVIQILKLRHYSEWKISPAASSMD